MFDQLSARLTEAIQRVTGRGRITEDNVRDTVRTIRMALLEADVALPVAKAFVDRVRDRALGEEVTRSLNPGQAFVKIVHDELVALLGERREGLRMSTLPPTIVMLVGLQGSGKTTTTAKLARKLKGEGRQTRLVALDVYEHAYFLDYQTDRGAYIDAFFRNLDWTAVNGWVEAYRIPTE